MQSAYSKPYWLRESEREKYPNLHIRLESNLEEMKSKGRIKGRQFFSGNSTNWTSPVKQRLIVKSIIIRIKSDKYDQMN